MTIYLVIDWGLAQTAFMDSLYSPAAPHASNHIESTTGPIHVVIVDIEVQLVHQLSQNRKL